MHTHYRIPSLITLLTFFALLLPAKPAQAVAGSGTVITVNTLIDDGVNGTCSLREAVRAANTDNPVDACPAGNGADTILLVSGVYQLSIGGVGEDNASTGDLDILEDLVIRGLGMGATFVDGGNVDRVFHILWADPPPVVRFESLTIQNGKVDDLTSGGGVRNEGTLTLNAVSLQHNEANYIGPGSAVGGGLYNYFGTVTIWNSSVSDNQAEDGGGIFNDGTLFMYRSTLSNNTASVEEGGALDNLDSATLENVTISGNSAVSGGGIFSDGTLWILKSTLSGNTASESGGALYNATDGTLENVTISGNSASSGGGIYNTGSLEVANSTIVENSALTVTPPAAPKGANIENEDTVQIKSSLIAGGQSAPNCAGSLGLTSMDHNLEDTHTCNFNAPNDLPAAGDPSLDVLADNGGPTLTHALLWNSPAVDMGDDLTCPHTDQRGAIRTGTQCDIGAYEFDGVFPSEYVFIPIIVR